MVFGRIYTSKAVKGLRKKKTNFSLIMRMYGGHHNGLCNKIKKFYTIDFHDKIMLQILVFCFYLLLKAARLQRTQKSQFK